jgi:general secretion pathway protein M
MRNWILELRTQLARAHASPLWQRWRQLAPHERLALSVLALFLLAAVGYGGLWVPVERSRAEALAGFQQQRELQAYLQARAPEVPAVGGRSTVRPAPADLQRLVTTAAERQGLAIERLDMEGEGGVQVALRPATFAALLDWFEVLERQGIGIEEAGLERHGEGEVVARLGLRIAH